MLRNTQINNHFISFHTLTFSISRISTIFFFSVIVWWSDENSLSEFRCDGYIYELIPKRWTGSTIGSIKSFLVSTRIDLSFCQKRSNSKSDNYQILFPSVSCHLVYDGVPYVVDFINVKFNSKMCIDILSCPSAGRTNIVHVTDKHSITKGVSHWAIMWKFKYLKYVK